VAATETSAWTGEAFGLSLRSEFPLPGLERSADSGAGGRGVILALSRESADSFAGAERMQEWHYPDGTLGLTIDRDGCRGYRFYLYGAGVFELAADGSRVICRLDRDFENQWHWRRYLIGQVLPFAAVLHGLEVFHASGIGIGSGAVVLLGPSGVGKSTLALNLHLAGARFLADDSVGVERSNGQVIAHPAIATAKIRQGARDLLRRDDRPLGEIVSEDEDEARIRVERSAEPLPLAAVCVLERGGEEGALEAAEAQVDPWELLGNTFNDLVRDPARLRTQLELCGQIGAEARFLRVRVGARPGADAAAALAAHLGKLTQWAGPTST
jgi:hypothetical protein